MGINNDFFIYVCQWWAKLIDVKNFPEQISVMKSAFSWHMKTCHDLEPYLKKIWHTY